jgi:hypothetical protein
MAATCFPTAIRALYVRLFGFVAALHAGVPYMARRSMQGDNRQLVYERVPISGLLKGRRGKHNDLVLGVLHDLSTLPMDEAVRIPLKKVGGVSLTNLRSAISRAAKTRKIKIRTFSDSDHLYLRKIEGLMQIHGSKKKESSRS